MTMVSYAQNGEDVRLQRAFRDCDKGFYVDIGAADPTVDSVTRHFYDRGWNGINVEPVAGFLKELRAARPRDLNIGVAVSNFEGTRTFYEGPDGYGGSTFELEVAQAQRDQGFELRETPVPVTTLARLFEQHVDGPIHFLKIDVEGHEREVIEGGNWEQWRPVVLVIEATVPHTQIPSHEQWEKLVLGADYVFAASDGLNRFYVRAEDRELAEVLSPPVNYLDDYEPFRYTRPIADLSNALGRARAENGELEARLADAGRRREAAERRLQELHRDFAQLAADLDRTKQQLEAHRVAIGETREHLAAAERRVVDTRVRLEATHTALIATMAEAASLRQQVDELRGAKEAGASHSSGSLAGRLVRRLLRTNS